MHDSDLNDVWSSFSVVKPEDKNRAYLYKIGKEKNKGSIDILIPYRSIVERFTQYIIEVPEKEKNKIPILIKRIKESELFSNCFIYTYDRIIQFGTNQGIEEFNELYLFIKQNI